MSPFARWRRRPPQGRHLLGPTAAALTGLLLLAGVAGVPAAAQPAVVVRHAPSSFLDDALRLLQPAFSEGRLFARSMRSLDAPLGATPVDLSRLIARAPAAAAPDEALALAALRARLRATELIQQGATVNRQVDGHAVAIAAGSTDDPAARGPLATVTRDTVKDLACGQLLDQLAPEEQSDAEAAGDPVWQDVGESGAEAVIDYAASRMGPAGAAVRWGQWWNGVSEDADQLVGAGQESVVYPTYVRSRAFYYYVKVCLQVPQ